MSRRRSTIHDVAALRLHPNGVRVNGVVQDTQRSRAPVTIRTPYHARRAPRGNWIATDAGGDGRVTKRRKVKVQSPGDVEEPPIAEDQGEGDTAETRLGGQGEEIPIKVYKDARANRRVAFESDLTFIAANTSVPEGNTSRLQPSSDFLKYIHHFTSQYYGSRGQLFDSAGQYRKVKKEKRQRLQAAAASGSRLPNASQDEGGNEQEERRAESNGSAQEVPTKATCKVKEKAKSGTSRQTQKDMYKAFDGSALLCIGMLLQSHIIASLANVPDTWEDDGSEDSHGDTETDPVELPSDMMDEARNSKTEESQIQAKAKETEDSDSQSSG